MRNQFFYTTIALVSAATETAPAVTRNEIDSFNLNKVIRSKSLADGTVAVILDDFNERVTQQPDIDLKTNKMKGYKNVRETVQSEIRLSADDAKRFFLLTNIEDPGKLLTMDMEALKELTQPENK
jgi:phosphoribosylformimino-5-aminoimidazole carboxamide ribonucleotide (ProFAR) isomerase